MVYYNEIDRFAAHWLRNLMAAGHLPQGTVDERDIRTLRAADLAGTRQAHFFAGIGGWPLALRLAGWPQNRPVWTGSCPCQPFSSAGKRRGSADSRHLWPAFFRLVQECRPSLLFGEQVDSPDGRAWLDGVWSDMEGAGYAFWPASINAAGVGAPHLRQRLYFVAFADMPRRADQGRRFEEKTNQETKSQGKIWKQDRQRLRPVFGGASIDEGMEYTHGVGRDSRRAKSNWWGTFMQRSPDGEVWRIEPGLEPVVDGIPFRLADGRTVEGTSRPKLIACISNAIVPKLAAEFIKAVMEIL